MSTAKQPAASQSPPLPLAVKRVIVILLSLLPLLAVIALITWRVLRARGWPNDAICALLFRIHGGVFLAVCLLALVISLAMTSGGTAYDPPNASDVWLCAQKAVREELKFPETADFCPRTEAAIAHQSGNRYRVTGYVTAENSLGIPVRHSFTVTLTVTASGYRDAAVTLSD